MSFQQFLTIVGKHWRLIALCFVLVGLGAYMGSKLMKPVYQSTALVQVAISSGNSPADYNNLLASNQLVQTEAQLATSDSVLAEVASHYPGLTSDQLSKAVSATPQTNTQLFQITVQDSSPTRAAALANDIAATLIKQQQQKLQQANIQAQQQLQQDLASTQQQIERITSQINTLVAQGNNQAKVDMLEGQLAGLQQHYTQGQAALAQLELAEAENSNFLEIAQPAQPASKPVQPNILLNTGVGLVIGLLLGMLLAVVFEHVDPRVRTSEALTKLLNWPVLTTIGYARSPHKEAVLNPTGRDENIEGYRFLRTNIGYIGKDKPQQSVMVTSALPHEGKSVISANLAIFMARAGKKTLLIDANLRSPTLHTLFDLSPDKMGLSNVLLALSQPKISKTTALDSRMSGITSAASRKLSEANRASSASSQPLHSTDLQVANGLAATELSMEPFTYEVGIPNLWVMPSGPLPADPPELLDSQSLQRLLRNVADDGIDVAIFDTPPVLGLSDVSILAPKMDATLVVVDITRANKKNLQQMKGLLVQAGAHVLGCVVNKQHQSRHEPTSVSNN